MAIIKVNSRLDEYKHRAKSNDINELSGRTNRSDVTLFVAQQIFNNLDLQPDDIFVDIGCGDGTLLEISKNIISSGTGVLPNNEEVSRVTNRFKNSNISIIQGFSNATGLKNDNYTKIASNSVFLLLNEDIVDKTLEEIYRISKPNALVFIGELPLYNEVEGKDYGNSIIKWLIWTYKNEGIKRFFYRLKQTINAVFSKEPFLVAPKEQYFVSKDDFIKQAENFGFELVDTFRHTTITEDKKLVQSPSRQDYIFKVRKENG